MHSSCVRWLRASVLASLLPVCAAAQTATEQVLDAYQHKDYPRCAKTALAAGDLYNAACCFALLGDKDAAFAALDRAIAKGNRDIKVAREDSDLNGLHSDSRWKTSLAAIQSNAEKYLKSIRLPAVREELRRMVKEDQDARYAAIKDKFKDSKLTERMGEIDHRNTARMKALVTQHGWLGKSLVGEDGAHDAWPLVQHADKDLAFQKQCLEKMKQGLGKGEVSPKDVAYLTDRVAVAEQRKQTYGTQFMGMGEEMKPQPIEDEEHVDERRKSVGLPSLAEYKKMIQQAYNSPGN